MPWRLESALVRTWITTDAGPVVNEKDANAVSKTTQNANCKMKTMAQLTV